MPLLRSLHGGAVNSHTFISFTNAILQSYAIERALSTLRPALAPSFRANASAYAQRLRKIKTDAARRLVGAKITRVVTVHDGYSYFCQELGRRGRGRRRAVARAGALGGRARRDGRSDQAREITVVLSEETFPDKLLQVLRDAGGVRVYVISHIASGEYTADKFEKEMAKNADTLVTALTSDPTAKPAGK